MGKITTLTPFCARVHPSPVLQMQPEIWYCEGSFGEPPMSGETLPLLTSLMARLRSPGGCPWDREQTHDTLKTYLVEEVYEVIEAIESGDTPAFREELGDLLLQIVFHSQIAEEGGCFNMDDVIRTIHDKLIRRHPHVFADLDVKTSSEVLHNWEAIKAREKQQGLSLSSSDVRSVLDGTPDNLPPLAHACQLTSRAARVGFDWKAAEDILDKLAEETGELRRGMARGDRREIAGEIGDLLFVVVNLARHLHVDPEVALRRTNRKFIKRFRYIEEQIRKQGRRMQDATLEEMDRLWDQSKGLEG